MIFGAAWTQATAQSEGTLTFMSSLPQVVINNPAFVPKYKLSIGIPGSSVMGYYSNNAFSYNDMITHVNDSVKADLSKLSAALKPKNYITQAAQVDVLRLGFRINSKWYVTLNSTAKAYNREMIPKEMVLIFVDGNTPFVGKTENLSPKVESFSLIETAVGASHQVNNNLTVGARIKYLNGLTNATTESSSLNLSTDKSSYALTASAGMDVRTSGTHNFTQSGFNLGNNIQKYLSNGGLAVDLGATYKFSNGLTLGASLIDIGAIRWKNDTYGYSLDPAKATYTFQGVDLGKVINGNSSYLNSLGDTLQNKFKVKEGSVSSYNTPLPGKMYLSGMYEIRKRFSVGAVFFAEKFRERFSSSLTLGVNKHFGKVFSASGTYSMVSNTYNNFGAGMSINLAPIQLYIVGDNLLSATLSSQQVNSIVTQTKFFNVRLGLNFIFSGDRRAKRKAKENSKADPNDVDTIKKNLYKNYRKKD
jgi:hypothetical protein